MTDKASGPPYPAATTTALMLWPTTASSIVIPFRAAELPTLEVRLPLLGERAGAFLGILALEDGEAQLGLEAEGVVLGQALGFADRAENGLHGERPVRRDRPGEPEGPVERLPVRDHMPDEPDLLRLGRLDVPAGEQEVRGDGVRDLPDEADGRTAEGE